MQNYYTRYLNTSYPIPVIDDGIYVEKGKEIFRWSISEPRTSNWQQIVNLFSNSVTHRFSLAAPVSGTFYQGDDISKSFWGSPSRQPTPIAFAIVSDEKPRKYTQYEVYKTFFDFMFKHKHDINKWTSKVRGSESELDSYWSFVSSEREKAQNTFCNIYEV